LNFLEKQSNLEIRGSVAQDKERALQAINKFMDDCRLVANKYNLELEEGPVESKQREGKEYVDFVFWIR